MAFKKSDPMKTKGPRFVKSPGRQFATLVDQKVRGPKKRPRG